MEKIFASFADFEVKIDLFFWMVKKRCFFVQEICWSFPENFVFDSGVDFGV